MTLDNQHHNSLAKEYGMTHRIKPEVLAEIAEQVVSEYSPEQKQEMFQAIRKMLAEHYPDLVDTTARCWIGSRAGGVLGKMTIMYASMSEYLIIFGTPTTTNGFSGRYNFLKIWDFFLTGETKTCDLESNQVEPNIYKAGDIGFLDKGDALSCDFEAGSWMIEYGRGPIFTALVFALADSVMSSVELKSVYLTIKEYSHFVLRNWIKK